MEQIESLIKMLLLGLVAFLFVAVVLKRLTGGYRAFNKKKNLSVSEFTEIDIMSGREFESYLEALFWRLGYRSLLTESSHDYGADLLMKSGRKKIVIQAKRYKGNVGIKAVQEVYSAQAYYKADEAYVFTNSGYTLGAQRLAKATGVILCGREDIIRLQKKIG